MSQIVQILVFSMALFAVIGCSSSGSQTTERTLIIGGIPDQNISLLEQRFGAMADYLSVELGVDVTYVPATEYSSLVTAFKNGDVMLTWFGGLTGLQAQSLTPGATAIAQRPRDREFTSVIVVSADSTITSLDQLHGSTFTFGSINSTSGHLMPRSFLLKAGIDPDTNFEGVPNYSGSHDLTWKLVESGSFEAGALNSAVWERAVREGQVDTSKVRVLYESPPYPDYQWVAHPDIDEVWGEGTVERISTAILGITTGTSVQAQILESFETDSFISVNPDDYEELEAIARSLDMLQ